MTKSRSDLTHSFTVRRLRDADTDDALSLYGELTVGPTEFAPEAFHAVLRHEGTQVFGAEIAGKIVAMVTIHILPNVTWGGRPYALVENVITSEDHRGKSIAKQVLHEAIEAAWHASCYKIMLLTGHGRGAKGFYQSVGFSDDAKFGMILKRP